MRTFYFVILIAFSFATSINAQDDFDIDLEMVLAEQDGHTLTMDDILVVLMYQQQSGLVSLSPTQEEIESVALITAQQFQLNPTQCMNEIQALRISFNYFGPDSEQTFENTQLQQSQSFYQLNQSQSTSSTQLEVEKNMTSFINNYYPNAKMDFSDANAIKVKSILSGAMIRSNQSDSYNSGSFGANTVTVTEFHLCPNGYATQVIASRILGGSDLGSFDSGGGDPHIEKGSWSVGVLNGQLALMLTVDGLSAGFPIVYEGQSLIMDGKRYNIHERAAVCY